MSELVARKAKIALSQFTRRYRSEPIELMSELRRDYGDFVYIPIMPGLTSYLIFSRDLAYDILVNRPEQFQKAQLGKKLFESSFGNGIFFSEGDFWRRQRKLAQPAFHHARINGYANDVVAATQKLIEQWYVQPTVEVDKAMRALTLIIVVNALFKTDVSGLTDTVGEAMHDLGEASGKQIVSLLDTFMPSWIPTPINRRKKRAVDVLNKIIYQLLANRRASPKDTGDLLSMFVQAKDEETGEQMTDQQVRDELMTMFIAGHETSAVALSWALVELARNPEIEARHYQELDSVLNGRKPELSDLPQLPYTLKIIKESLRMYPPALFIAREPIAKTKIGASMVNKGALINILPAMLHRDERWFPEPNRFNPDRFTDDFEKSLPKCTYLPFGAGPRICIGNSFAMMEMQLVLATIVQQFHLNFVAGHEKVQTNMLITLGFKEPVVMQATERVPQPVVN